ncbi:MAG: FAD-dependent oxidoreductase [Casimicrobiaceae bacterium]
MSREHHEHLILGAGVTGLGAGIASGYPIFEASAYPGGICSSYYVSPGNSRRLADPGADGEAYRFEHGGGHWIFGGHPDVLSIIERLAPCERIARKSSVYFPGEDRFVAYPIQHHLHQLGPQVAARCVGEMLADPSAADVVTMADWLHAQFGPSLGELFFEPFHDAYTCGLWRSIAPQDGYKTPIDKRLVTQGASGAAPAVGYNVTFLYPHDGLDALIGRLAAKADVRYESAVVKLHLDRRELVLGDGRVVGYRRLLSTLPLNRLVELAGLSTQAPSDPYTSVLVLNIGAARGSRCPDDHWLYIPRSRAGFHRVGFYSNVQEHFLPVSGRGRNALTCLYVERSYVGGEKPDDATIAGYATQVVEELREWRWIDRVDALDPSWVDVAYTWAHPGSTWVREATAALARHDVSIAGRYARWTFQGIADSLRDGLLAGQAMRLAASDEAASGGDCAPGLAPAGGSGS